MALDETQFEALKTQLRQKQQGLPQEQFDTLRARLTERKKEVKPNFLQRTVQRIKGAFSESKESVQRSQETGELKAGISGGLGIAGDVVGAVTGTAFDAALSAVKVVTPDFIERAVVEKGKDFLQTEAGQSLLNKVENVDESWQEFSKRNPNAADALEGLLNLADIVPASIAKRSTKEVLEQARKQAGETVGQRAGTVARGLDEKATAQSKQELDEFLSTAILDDTTKGARRKLTSQKEEGGFFTPRKVTLTPNQKEILSAVSSVKGISADNTFQQNRNVLSAEVRKSVDTLSERLKESKVPVPRKETIARINKALNQTKENPFIENKQQIKEFLAVAQKAVNNNPGTAYGVLQARKEFDEAVTNFKGDGVFEKGNVTGTIVRDIRTALNDIVDAKVKDIGVKKELKRQNRLLNTMEVFGKKAVDEGETGFSRQFRKLAKVSNINQTALGLLLGVIGTQAFALAPALFKLAAAGYAIRKGTKWVLSSKGKQKASELLKQLDTQAKKVSPDEAKEIKTIMDRIKTIINEGIEDVPAALSTGITPDHESEDK